MNFDTSKRAVRFLIIMLILGGCNETGDTARDTSPDRKADESAIHALLTANFAASTTRNAAGVAETYMADGDAQIAGLPRVSTHDAIRSLEEDFGSMPGFQSYDGRIENIRFISRDAAIVEILGTTTLDTGSLNVCFHRKRSFKLRRDRQSDSPLTARSGRSHYIDTIILIYRS